MPRNENSTDYHPVIARLMEIEEQPTYVDPDQEDLFGAKPVLPEIVDDGTLDTAVSFGGEIFRYDSQYRYSFENDTEFLETIASELEDEIPQEKVLTLDDALEAANSDVEIERAPKTQTSLFGDAEAWEKDWQGMPDFLQEDLRPARTLYVHFRTDDDVNDFLDLMGQTITPKTQYIWFPYMKLASFDHLHWVVDEEQQ
tara:strand:- start:4168 stop:4764 length:597 start_codon:yes stop_codon:yes gene_type:complete